MDYLSNYCKGRNCMEFDTIKIDRMDTICLLTLNRPERLNAMSQKMLSEIAAACDVFEQDTACKVVVVTGSVDDEIVNSQRDKIVKCTGKAGSVCLMHASLLHGSAPNLSDQPRTLYITTYYAEDAIELSPNHLPSKFTHELVRGEATGRVRCTPYEMKLPALPKGTSFFAQQEGTDSAGGMM